MHNRAIFEKMVAFVYITYFKTLNFVREVEAHGGVSNFIVAYIETFDVKNFRFAVLPSCFQEVDARHQGGADGTEKVRDGSEIENKEWR